MTRRPPRALALLDLIDALNDHIKQLTAERDGARDIAMRLADEVADAEMWWVRATDRLGFSTGVTCIRTHHRDACQGRPCPVHHPSNHPMVSWPQVFRADKRATERVCHHGIGHPDPDDPATDRVHGCDGCCDGDIEAAGPTYSTPDR